MTEEYFISSEEIQKIVGLAETREEREALNELIQFFDLRKLTPEEIKQIYEAYLLGKDARLFELAFVNGSTCWVFSKIKEFKVKEVYIKEEKRHAKALEIKLENDKKVLVPPILFQKIAKERTPRELLKDLSGFVYGEIADGKGFINIKFIHLEPDIDTARKLWEKYGVPILIEGIGLKFNYTTFRLTLPRLLPLFKVYVSDKYPSSIHLMQLTISGVGKSTFAHVLKNVANIGIIPGLPSPARLVYNANTGSYGEVMLRDVIVIDEFDKAEKQKWKEIIGHLLNGMASGVWTREVSGKAKEFRKDVAFMFFGNIPAQLLEEVSNTRDYARKLLISKYEDETSVDSLLDRIHMIDVYDGEQIGKYASGKYLLARYYKGLLRYLEKKANEIQAPDFGLNGRREFQARQVYKVLSAMGFETAEQLARELVLGNIKEYEKLLQEEYTRITGESVGMEEKVEEQNKQEEKNKKLDLITELLTP